MKVIKISSLPTLKQETRLIKYYPEAELKAGLSGLLHTIITINKPDFNPEASAMIVEACLDPYDSLGLFARALIKFSKTKTYGEIIPTLEAILVEERELEAQERESRHSENKGYSSEDLSPRTSSRIQEKS
jgi:hypothetical protein